MNDLNKYIRAISALFMLAFSCSTPAPEIEQNHWFRKVDESLSNITFVNQLDDSTDYNFFNYMNLYAGGGAAVGDIDNNGLLDFVLTSNLGQTEVYLNMGDLQFENITEQSNVFTGKSWVSGATFADVNGDGFDDLYICRTGRDTSSLTSNMLFINNGDNTFTDKTLAYGVGRTDLSMHASFFDMDNDGDLDLYVLNTPFIDFIEDPNAFAFIDAGPQDEAYMDRLYENVGGYFEDVTKKAGLPIETGSGLGLVCSDINGDGWVDIYVANDWIENDKLYINNQDGTFTNRIQEYFYNTSYFSMGMDIADVNNDGIVDVYVNDMAPSSHYRRNMLMNFSSIDFKFLQEKSNLVNQLSKNTLQLSTNDGYLEVGDMFNVARTDWSWSALLFDANNDGNKDLFVANGTKRDVGNIDVEMLMFDKEDDIEYKFAPEKLIGLMPQIKTFNRFFINQGSAGFYESAFAAGLKDTVNTQGAAYADFNNDGQIDLLLNNSESKALLYENVSEGNFLRVKINGDKQNTRGIGTKAWVFMKDGVRYSELCNSRGFQSNSEAILHFGLGQNLRVDSVVVRFLSGKEIKLYDVEANQQLSLNENEASTAGTSVLATTQRRQADWENVSEEKFVHEFYHQEAFYSDFKHEKLIHRQFSKMGPALSVADVNHDGLEDFYLGGGAGQAGILYLQVGGGKFERQEVASFDYDHTYEDVHAVFEDFNGDGHPDLFVLSGSNEHSNDLGLFQDRLYLGDGNGDFHKCSTCLPEEMVYSYSATTLDYDEDGLMDIFVGGLVEPGNYGRIPRSYLLHNMGNGEFELAPEKVNSAFQDLGMLSSSEWADIDGDGSNELILAGHWMPISVFKYVDKQFENKTEEFGLANTAGWWNAISLADLDHDGFLDIIAANWGQNSIFRATPEEPIRLYVNDFDKNGKEEPILTLYLEGVDGLLYGRSQVCQAMPAYFNKFQKYETFAKASVPEILTPELFQSTLPLEVNELTTGVFFNDKQDKFVFKPLPWECQVAPITAFLHTGKGEFLLGGGFNQNHYLDGNIVGFNGYKLMVDNARNMQVETNVFGPIDPSVVINNMGLISAGNERLIILALNGKEPRIYR